MRGAQALFLAAALLGLQQQVLGAPHGHRLDVRDLDGVNNLRVRMLPLKPKPEPETPSVPAGTAGKPDKDDVQSNKSDESDGGAHMGGGILTKGQGAEVKDLAVYQTKGSGLRTQYETNTKSDVQMTTDPSKVHFPTVFPDIVKMPGSPYAVTSTDVKWITSKDYKHIKTAFTKEDLGFEMPKGDLAVGSYVKVTNKEGATAGETPGIITDGLYDKNGQYIMAGNAFKENDHVRTAAKDNNKALTVPVNEASFQAFQHAAGENTKNLKVIFLVNIQNAGFLKIASQSYREKGILTNQKAVWLPGTPGSKDAEYFDRFLGSDNAAGKVQQLINHKDAIGDKKIARIVTVPAEAKGSGSKMTAAIVFE